MKLLPVPNPTDVVNVLVVDTKRKEFVRVSGEVLARRIEYRDGRPIKLILEVATVFGIVRIYKEILYDVDGNVTRISEWKM